MKQVSISIDKIINCLYRSGDIDNRHIERASSWQMQDVKRRMRRRGGLGYEKRTNLKYHTRIGQADIVVSGKPDGWLMRPDGSIFLECIEVTTIPLPVFRQFLGLHEAGAKGMLWLIYSVTGRKCSGFEVRLTHHQLDVDEQREYRFQYQQGEIERFGADMLREYQVWFQLEYEWYAVRNASIERIVFPHPAYRDGQRKMMAGVYHTVKQKGRLYIQAPTGIGKTLSTLYPTLKAMGEGEVEKIFYLTAKTVTRTVAEEAVSLLLPQGLRLKSITMRAKEKICFCLKPDCNPQKCTYAKGHYNRVNGAVLQIWREADLITPQIIEKYAKEHRVCPYELILDIANWTDLVVCDYNHVFDPFVNLNRFFDGEDHGYVFLIDEVHNLADRVRDMYTAVVMKSEYLAVFDTMPGTDEQSQAVRQCAGQLNRYLLDARRELGEKMAAAVSERDVVLCALLKLWLKAAAKWLAQEQNKYYEIFDFLQELYMNTSAFLAIADYYDGHFRMITESEGTEVKISMFCVDPAAVIDERLKAAGASVLFSATLTPLPYYREALGGREEDGMLSLPSPFDQERLLLAAYGGITTKYTQRSAGYDTAADLIFRVVSHHPGNYIAYFPSYDYMNRIHAIFSKKYGKIETLLQEGQMEEEERLAFIRRFDGGDLGYIVGFCVLGGIFSEGIDLKGERLVGAFVFGVGLPGISFRQELIRSYYEEELGRGFAYAYVYPGMNKVLQAAGRVIRSEEDYGIVVLADSRFYTEEYQQLYPAHWGNMKWINGLSELDTLLDEFEYF